MNVTDEDLGDAFVNLQNPEIKPTYEIIGKQPFQIKGKVYCLVAMGVTNPNTYHVSSGTNYIACFEIKDNNWRLEYPSKNTEFTPSVGFGNPAWLDKFVLYGDKSLAVVLEGGYTGTGLSMGSRAIYGLDDTHNIFLLYEGQSYNNDQANQESNWFQNIDIEINIKFQKSIISRYYDLVETEKSHGKIVKTTILKFNETAMKYD